MPALPQSPLLWQGAAMALLGVCGSVMHVFHDFFRCTKAPQMPHFQGRLASPHHTPKACPHACWEGVSEGALVGLACPPSAAMENP